MLYRVPIYTKAYVFVRFKDYRGVPQRFKLRRRIGCSDQFATCRSFQPEHGFRFITSPPPSLVSCIISTVMKLGMVSRGGTTSSTLKGGRSAQFCSGSYFWGWVQSNFGRELAHGGQQNSENSNAHQSTRGLAIPPKNVVRAQIMTRPRIERGGCPPTSIGYVLWIMRYGSHSALSLIPIQAEV
ncbi:hypothetical protein K438DRAFT_1785399 [Mycena galopus ATCC 62051]|nr:hypothetical protein K438DRAFT_1785399 [Mycena galopus ATCC 62051]